MHYSHEATANRVPGHPLVLAAGGTLGRLLSTPVLENVEVVAAARGVGGEDTDDDDDNYDDDNKELASRYDTANKKLNVIRGPRHDYL